MPSSNLHSPHLLKKKKLVGTWSLAVVAIKKFLLFDQTGLTWFISHYALVQQHCCWTHGDRLPIVFYFFQKTKQTQLQQVAIKTSIFKTF